MTKARSIIEVDTTGKTTFTLREFCEHGEVHAEFVIKLVNYGVIDPIDGGDAHRWSFDLPALARLRKAQRLQRDLRLNLPGLAMSLELLDDVTELRREVERLNHLLAQLMRE